MPGISRRDQRQERKKEARDSSVVNFASESQERVSEGDPHMTTLALGDL